MCLTDTVGPGAKAEDRLRLPLTLQLTQIMDNDFRALGPEFPYFLKRKLTLKKEEHALCEYDKYFRAVSKLPTRERIFYSNTCMVCTMTSVTTSTRCVLCGWVTSGGSTRSVTSSRKWARFMYMKRLNKNSKLSHLPSRWLKLIHYDIIMIILK